MNVFNVNNKDTITTSIDFVFQNPDEPDNRM